MYAPLCASLPSTTNSSAAMSSSSLFTTSHASSLLLLPFPYRGSLNCTLRPFPLSCRPMHFLRFAPTSFSSTSSSKVASGIKLDGLAVDLRELGDIDGWEVLVETCVTRTLPPALTLQHGLESIKEAVEELKFNPPSSSAGVVRIQVAVPPSTKAFHWFCCQPENTAVFPLLFLSKETESPTSKSLYMNSPYGVFGIGVAISFPYSPSIDSGQAKVVRYLSDDSVGVTIYGFMDIGLESDSSVKHEAGSSYFFIPQIELNEHEGVSVLAATLAWDESYTFEWAIRSYESSLHQVTRNIWHTAESGHLQQIRAARRKLLETRTKTGQILHVETILMKDVWAKPGQLRGGLSFSQFYCRLSPSIAITNNMVDYTRETNCFTQDKANINAVWASLIVEEFSRLGVTYFCIAPGSRSSPLAIAATSHPLVTCVSCYDERSLAFHAIGYARGSLRPAVVITSSGTAVSNLLPAAVEASQDFIPLLLLTADRPPELHDAGANQAVNQVNHFGSHVRFFFNLPPPTDEISARMILTTIDSAVHWATSSPYGPVHINCPFREPLDDSPNVWSLNCLRGLDNWKSAAEPFTKYFRLEYSCASPDDNYSQISDVFEIIRGAKKGVLLVGAAHSHDEIWAVLLLARKLLWPVVVDILSGLRLRKMLTPFVEVKENILFVDHFDHFLLSDSFREWTNFDVVLQIGSRVTSKQVPQMLEECFPFSYILVTNHPCRHDPSHLVTHRIQGTVVDFADQMLRSWVPQKEGMLQNYLQPLNSMIAWEISFQISVEHSLTEPYVAHIMSQALTSKSSLFIGNSMPIRDADNYGCSWGDHISSANDILFSSGIPCHWIRVAGNRGASGIDGLLSTALGFAEGCRKRVLCVFGDISFLHDTNGLSLLRQRTPRKPVTILVINNRGGAIFSLLPLAQRADPNVLNQYFYTTHNISIANLCLAHGVQHQLARSKEDLQNALLKSQQESEDCVIEVEGSIDRNSTFHSALRRFAHQAVDNAWGVLSRSLSVSSGYYLSKIHQMHYSLYRIQLSDRPTTNSTGSEFKKYCREGFILSLMLEDGSVGCGEVAPLEIHEENLIDVEEQLHFLLHITEGAKISNMLPLLGSSISSWLWSELGIPVISIFPSVRCGLEMALLNAIAARQGSSLLQVLCPQPEERTERLSSIRICALVDSRGTPKEVAYVARQLVEEGFAAIKLKVARHPDPIWDATVIQEVRKVVGYHVDLRADANRSWSYEEALKFSLLVKSSNLQFIEEPVKEESDIIKFCEVSGLPVALDETVDSFRENYFDMFHKYDHPGIVAVVIKPSVVGGFENAALLAKWAHQRGKMAVISSAFESGFSLSAYIVFSSYLENQHLQISREFNLETGPPVAQGLGTYRWLREDIIEDSLGILRNPCNGFVEASVNDASRILQKLQINQDAILLSNSGQAVSEHVMRVDMKDTTHFIKVYETGPRNEVEVMIFLHGFLGSGSDWIPTMKGLSGIARCISVDLPGHGSSKIEQNLNDYGTSEKANFSIQMFSATLSKLIQQLSPNKITLVGYSMGARIGLYMALRYSYKINGVVLISGSPGIREPAGRKVRRAKDDSMARMLVTHGLRIFLENWYLMDLWKSLRRHPHFARITASRMLHADVNSVAAVLSGLSVGRQPSLWQELKKCNVNVLLIVGEEDTKFMKIAREMLQEMNESNGSNKIVELAEIPDSGHAVHLENCLPVIRAIRKFARKVQESWV